MKKILFLLLASSISVNAVAQKKTFVRIFNLAGSKIGKGFFAGTTDSSILLYKNDSLLSFPVARIGIIKTKRSAGNAMATGALIGGVPMAVIGGASGEPNVNNGTLEGAIHDAFTPTPESGATGGLLFGAAAGALVGGAISLAKNKPKFIIDGKPENWAAAKAYLDKLPVYMPEPATQTTPAN